MAGSRSRPGNVRRRFAHAKSMNTTRRVPAAVASVPTFIKDRRLRATWICISKEANTSVLKIPCFNPRTTNWKPYVAQVSLSHQLRPRTEVPYHPPSQVDEPYDDVRTGGSWENYRDRPRI